MYKILKYCLCLILNVRLEITVITLIFGRWLISCIYGNFRNVILDGPEQLAECSLCILQAVPGHQKCRVRKKCRRKKYRERSCVRRSRVNWVDQLFVITVLIRRHEEMFRPGEAFKQVVYMKTIQTEYIIVSLSNKYVNFLHLFSLAVPNNIIIQIFQNFMIFVKHLTI